MMAWGVRAADLRRYLRRGLLLRTGRGRYALPLEESVDAWERMRSQHLQAAAAFSAPDSVLASGTAAIAWDRPVAAIPDHPQLIRPPGSTRPTGAVTRHRILRADDVCLHGGLYVTSISRLAIDLALELPAPEALVTVDSVVRSGVTPSQLLAALEARGPVRNCRRASQTLQWSDAHSESALESWGRGELLVRGVPRPDCNRELRFGGREIRPDLLWLDLGIAAEADGRGKYDDDPDALWREKRRQEWMESELGLLVLRFNYAEVRTDPAGLASRWFRLAERRATEQWVWPAGLYVKERADSSPSR
jgi:hypothetical protein